jgi:Ca2+-binding RTX toxin-like protein
MLGNDVLIDIENVIAGVGNDIIIANDKQNDLSGGDGEDTFVFHTSVAIGNGHGSSDRILDFAVGDRIDLDQISNEFADLVDAAFTDQTMQKFMIISGQSQFATPGQLRVKYDVYDGHDVTILEGNVDFDEAAEFALEFLGHHQLDDYRFSHAISHGSA